MVVLMVYRARNAHLVRALLIQVGSDADVRLWAFDDVVPELADRTVGCGSGTRFANLNKLYNSKPVDPRAWVMVADDDTFFVRGDLASMVTLMQRAEFSLAQPGQARARVVELCFQHRKALPHCQRNQLRGARPNFYC